ncbi:alpha/beta hydrolase [Pseudomonas sp. WN033]|nr:alpha/beta hydrolase [Pseudomonas sp. WN033]
MPLDLHLAGVLKGLAAAGRKPTHECTVDEARAGYFALTRGTLTAEQVVPVGSTEDITIPGGTSDVRARIYRPDHAKPVPTIVFFHGGGFVLGDLDTHDNMCREICRESDAVILSVEYRLAPEAPFPAAVADAIIATDWAFANLPELGGTDSIGVAGDSAGGNLAAVIAQRSASHGVKLAGQFLIYPALDTLDANYLSRSENAKGYFLEMETMAWFVEKYAAEHKDLTDPMLAPIHAKSVAGVAPALIIAAEFDPLRDEALVYGEKLMENGVVTELVRADGMIHAFFDMGRWSPAAQQLITSSCQRFGELLRGA